MKILVLLATVALASACAANPPAVGESNPSGFETAGRNPSLPPRMYPSEDYIRRPPIDPQSGRPYGM